MISAAHRRTSADQILQAFGIDGAELISSLMGGVDGALRPGFQGSLRPIRFPYQSRSGRSQ